VDNFRSPSVWTTASCAWTATCRTGVLEYLRTDGKGIRREYRPPEEVFHKDSLASLDLAPVTNDHPWSAIGQYVTRRTAKSSASAPPLAGPTGRRKVAASLQIEDARAIKAVQAGRQELSCGYECDMDPTPGISPEGLHYDCIQKNIRYNHVALVDAGRAGPEVRVRMDTMDMVLLPSRTDDGGVPQSQQEKLVKLTIDGIEVEIPDTAGAVVTKALKDREAKADAAEKAKTETQAKLDASAEKIAQVEKARADAADPKRFDAAVTARVELLTKAAEVLGKAPEAGTPERDVKVAVIQKFSPSFKADGKDDVYVSARYDAALELASSEVAAGARAASSPIPASAVKADGKSVDLEKARADFEARNQNAWKTPAK
jgi:hypothetical protein